MNLDVGMDLTANPPLKPQMTDYQEPADFLRDQLEYLRRSDRTFSVLKSSQGLRKLSPTLVSLVLKGKRKITLDRAEEFARLLRLTGHEKTYFKDWIRRREAPETDIKEEAASPRARKDVSQHLLSDWLNPYVKDCFQIPEVQKDPSKIYPMLANIAGQARIDRSLQFLLREGHLRRTLDGRIDVEANLAAVPDSPLPSAKIRKFHKAVLQIAKDAIDTVSPKERLANSLIIPLSERSHAELIEMIGEFGAKLQEFASRQTEPGERLYQLIINVSPTGGKVE